MKLQEPKRPTIDPSKPLSCTAEVAAMGTNVSVKFMGQGSDVYMLYTLASAGELMREIKAAMKQARANQTGA